MNRKNKEEARLEITYYPLSSGRWRWWICLSIATAGPARRRSIHGWPWSRRLRLACSRMPAGMGISRRRRRTFKNYVTNGRKATLIGNDVRTSFKRIIPSLGRLGLRGPRH